MVTGSCCAAPAARFFDESRAGKELRAYHRKGPGKTTRRLLAALRADGAGGTLLDLGSGSGVLTLELLKSGVTRADCVDLSPGSLRVARAEAHRQGLAERITWHEGDVVELGPALPPADIVTLDRVVCCYPEYGPLLDQAARHSRQWLALSYPRDRWYVRLGIWLENLVLRLQRDSFRAFGHPVAAMDALLRQAGFVPVGHDATLVWESSLYRRQPSP